MKHEGKYRCEGMIDFWDCSCGWTSGPYFDGDVYAKEAWEHHVKDELKDNSIASQ